MPALADTGTGRWLVAAALALGLVAGAGGAAPAQTSDLVSESAFRVCADPANMPFSNEAGEGFENRIAELFAEKLDRPLQYTWFPQATGFVRKTLMEGRCDVVIGFGQGHEMVLNTNHYYTSAYVLVARADSPLAEVDDLAAPELQGKRIGLVAGTPPGTHLARHGLIGLARPYELFVDRRHQSPNEDMIADLKAGEIDLAVMWGPIGGYHARQSDGALVATPLLDHGQSPKLFYRVTMGVRQGEVVWKRELNSLIRRHQDEIDAILRDFGVPLLDEYGKELKG